MVAPSASLPHMRFSTVAESIPCTPCTVSDCNAAAISAVKEYRSASVAASLVSSAATSSAASLVSSATSSAASFVSSATSSAASGAPAHSSGSAGTSACELTHKYIWKVESPNTSRRRLKVRRRRRIFDAIPCAVARVSRSMVGSKVHLATRRGGGSR